MKFTIIGLWIMAATQLGFAQELQATQTEMAEQTPEQQEIINLSQRKWDWMAEKNVDSLAQLFR